MYNQAPKSTHSIFLKFDLQIYYLRHRGHSTLQTHHLWDKIQMFSEFAFN